MRNEIILQKLLGYAEKIIAYAKGIPMTASSRIQNS